MCGRPSGMSGALVTVMGCEHHFPVPLLCVPLPAGASCLAPSGVRREGKEDAFFPACPKRSHPASSGERGGDTGGTGQQGFWKVRHSCVLLRGICCYSPMVRLLVTWISGTEARPSPGPVDACSCTWRCSVNPHSSTRETCRGSSGVMVNAHV